MNGWPGLVIYGAKSNLSFARVSGYFFASIKAIRRRTMMLIKPTINVAIIPRTSPMGTLISSSPFIPDSRF